MVGLQSRSYRDSTGFNGLVNSECQIRSRKWLLKKRKEKASGSGFRVSWRGGFGFGLEVGFGVGTGARGRTGKFRGWPWWVCRGRAVVLAFPWFLVPFLACRRAFSRFGLSRFVLLAKTSPCPCFAPFPATFFSTAFPASVDILYDMLTVLALSVACWCGNSFFCVLACVRRVRLVFGRPVAFVALRACFGPFLAFPVSGSFSPLSLRVLSVFCFALALSLFACLFFFSCSRFFSFFCFRFSPLAFALLGSRGARCAPGSPRFISVSPWFSLSVVPFRC